MIPPAIPVTFFTNFAAQFKREEMIDPAELARMIGDMVAAEKARLPWLKLARFGNNRSEKRSLRHDANLRTISGAEGDYDGEEISFDRAVAIARAAGLFCIIYTSPSHTGERPRWRVLCPTSRELPPAERTRLMARLNGLYNGIFAVESFTLSQSYYYGHLAGSRDHRVELVGGACIDELNELDAGAIGKPNGQAPPHEPEDDRHGDPEADIFDVFAALAAIPNNGATEWNGWNRIGLAICAATGGSNAGGVAFHTWSQKNAAYDQTVTEERWQHIIKHPPNRIGAGTLFHLARETWPEWEKPSDLRRRRDNASGDKEEAGWGGPQPGDKPWPEMEAEAFYGPAGDVVEALAPTTEADPVAILAHLLVEVGNAIGRRSYCVADGARHYPNLYMLLVGDTSKGRKGTAARRVEQIMDAADSDWYLNCRASGLSSGEGIIHAVHDEIRSREKTGGGKNVQYAEVVKHPGITDKRLLIVEPEFAGALGVMRREGSTLSRVIREAYDSGNLRVLIKNSPERATGAHISIIGHITTDEYRQSLDRTSIVNGYANRFLNVMTRRAQELPFGGSLGEATVTGLADRIRRALENTALHREIIFTKEARELWIAHYHELSAAKPGIFGSIVARGEAHTLRLALLYALLDERRQIDPTHLRAALAFWQYCEASAKYIFGDALGDPTADAILQALRQSGAEGMTRTQISEQLFGRNTRADKIGAALALLVTHGKARCLKRSTGASRPAEVWLAA